MEQRDMNTPPFFSVVIPTYNCARLLEKALASVFDQTCQDFEIIVVDNSSTDETGEILGAINDPRLSIVRVRNHGVIAYSRNRGIKKAKGKWISFLDSDDIWLPGKLEKVQTAVLNNPDAVLVYHDAWLVFENGKRIHRRTELSGPNLYERVLFRGSSLSSSIITIRGDVAERTEGFSERKEFVTAEDYEYVIRLSNEGEFLFVDEILSTWNIHNENASGNSKVHAKALISVVEHHLRIWFQDHPGMNAKVRRRTGGILSSAGHVLLKGKEFSKARDYSIRAICANPFLWKAWVVLILSLLRIPL